MDGEAPTPATPQPDTHPTPEPSPEPTENTGSIIGNTEAPPEDTGSILGKTDNSEIDNTKESADQPAPEQPIEYEDFTLPEGMRPDAESMSQAKEAFKELGLSQEQSQKLVDMNTHILQQALAAKDQQWLDTTDNWAKEVRSDPELGGRNYKNSVARAERALAKFDQSGELTDFLVTTQAGNNPAFMKFLVGVDKATSEDSFERGGSSGKPKEISDAEAFYPEQYKREQIYNNL